MSRLYSSEQLGLPILHALGVDVAHVTSLTLHICATELPTLTVVRHVRQEGVFDSRPTDVARLVEALHRYELVLKPPKETPA